jgi:hypothetical protein
LQLDLDLETMPLVAFHSRIEAPAAEAMDTKTAPQVVSIPSRLTILK